VKRPRVHQGKLISCPRCARGTDLRGLAGFCKSAALVTTSLVDLGGRLPLTIESVDQPEVVERLLSKLRQMARKRPMTPESLDVHR